MATRKHSNAKEKIVEAASDLFFEQGYQATTIDHVIERSGVSRPTLYTHFKTKEELCVEYLRDRRRLDLGLLKETMRKEKTAKGRFLTVARVTGKNLSSTQYRGCRYFNMISEVVDCNSPIAKEARLYVDGFREMVKDGVLELKGSSPKYKKLDVDRIAEAYYLIIGGAIMASQEYRERWPIDRALKEIERLMEV
ncbi:MAG: TetR/AcrR family transcriptional regulator [Nitrospinaceae bacterium]